MANPAASPAVSSTVGLKNMVIAPLTVDTEETLTYGALQLVAGAIEASITPQNADPDVQYFDDQEGDVLYPDPELSFKTKLADLPLIMDEIDRMDMPGFLKIRAWNANREQEKKAPRQRYIDEVWTELKT